MSHLSRAFTLLLPVVSLALVQSAHAQSTPSRTGGASQITVDGATYTVLVQGSFLKVSDAGNHLIGVGNTRDGSVIAPQSGEKFEIVQKVVVAYRSGGAAGTTVNPAPAGNDVSARVTSPASPAGREAAPARAVSFGPGGEAIVQDPDRGTVTISSDGTKFSFLKDKNNPDAGEASVVYVGSKDGPSAAKKVGKFAGSALGAVVDRRHGYIQTNGDNDWSFRSKGGVQKNEIAWYTTGSSQADERYKAPAVAANQARILARQLLADEAAAVDVAGKKKATGEDVLFSPIPRPLAALQDFASAK